MYYYEYRFNYNSMNFENQENFEKDGSESEVVLKSEDLLVEADSQVDLVASKSKDPAVGGKIGKGLALGATIMAGYMGTGQEAEAQLFKKKDRQDTRRKIEQTVEENVKIDAAYITNFIAKANMESVRVALSRDDAEISQFISKIDDFKIKILFTALTSEDKKALEASTQELEKTVKRLNEIVLEINEGLRVRIEEGHLMKIGPNDTSYGINVFEQRKAAIASFERRIRDNERLIKKGEKIIEQLLLSAKEE